MQLFFVEEGAEVFAGLQFGNATALGVVNPRSTRQFFHSEDNSVWWLGAYGVSGSHDVLPVSSTQPNIASTASIGQTHLVASANSAQPNVATSAAITLGGMVTAANSAQINIASASAIGQTHLVGVASASQGNVASAGAVSIGGAYWPTPAQVLVGVTYGPTGAEYTGTAIGSGPTAESIAAAVRIELAAELAQLTKVSKIHGVGVPLVVTPTTRTAGDLSQSISTVGDTTTVSAV